MLRSVTIGIIAIGAILMLYFGLFEKNESDTKKIFTSDEVVWFGLDFTKAHFVGRFDQGFGIEPASGNDLRTKWIPAWNNLIAIEQQNFNLKRSFRKKYVYYDLSSVNQLNEKLNPDLLLNYNETKISKEAIKEMVQLYSSDEKKEGLGLVFIIENFNKNSKKAGLFVTFFDIATKKILLCEFMSGDPVGYGLRNYWAGAIKDILHWVDFYEYNKWKNKIYNTPPDDEGISNLQKSPE